MLQIIKQLVISVKIPLIEEQKLIPLTQCSLLVELNVPVVFPYTHSRHTQVVKRGTFSSRDSWRRPKQSCILDLDTHCVCWMCVCVCVSVFWSSSALQ